MVANLDEPIDEGMVVEISYAHLIGKPVLGFRTDIRSPYGDKPDPLGGIHFFVAYQCDDFISQYMPSKKSKDADQEMINLVDQLVEKMTTSNRKRPSYLLCPLKPTNYGNY